MEVIFRESYEEFETLVIDRIVIMDLGFVYHQIGLEVEGNEFYIVSSTPLKKEGFTFDYHTF